MGLASPHHRSQARSWWILRIVLRTGTMKNTLLDILAAVAIGLALAALALAYFDVLTK
jgi:hypothetical protein